MQEPSAPMICSQPLPIDLNHPCSEMFVGGISRLEETNIWFVLWPVDRHGRSLLLSVSRAPFGRRAASAINEPFEGLDVQFALTRGITTDQQRHESADEVDLWDGTAEWAYGSDRPTPSAEFEPGEYQSKGAGERRHIVAFRWVSQDGRSAISGAMSEVLPDGEWLDPDAALRSLGIKFVPDAG